MLRILAESTCGDDSFVDTTQEGMVFTGTVSSPRTLKVAFVEQVGNVIVDDECMFLSPKAAK